MALKTPKLPQFPLYIIKAASKIPRISCHIPDNEQLPYLKWQIHLKQINQINSNSHLIYIHSKLNLDFQESSQ